MTDLEALTYLYKHGWRASADHRLVSPWCIEGDIKHSRIASALAEQRATEQLAHDRLVTAATGSGYVEPLACPDALPE